MAEDQFKLPISSYEEIIKIIQGYGANLNKEASIDDINKCTGINRTVVSANNGFLVSIGIIEGSQRGKKLTDNGRALALALQGKNDEMIQKFWADLIENNDFLQKILSAIKIRNGMDRATLITHIIYTSGKKRDDKSLAGSNAIIEIFKISHFVEEKDDKLRSISENKHFQDLETSFYKKQSTTFKEIGPKKEMVASKEINTFENSALRINVNINVNCNIEEFEKIIQKFKPILPNSLNLTIANCETSTNSNDN